MEEKPRSCRVVYANKNCKKNLSDLSLATGGGDVFFLFQDSCVFQAPHFRVHGIGF